MPLGDTVLEQVELGPATEIDSGATASSGNEGYDVKKDGGNFDSAVAAGDLIVIEVESGRWECAIITSVNDDEATLSKQISEDSVAFRVMRPMECLVRPHMNWEWELHTIVATPRIRAGVIESLRGFPIEVWSTDDNKPKTLLLTTEDHTLDVTDTTDVDYPHFTLDLARFDLTIKPTYFSWLLVRNYQPVRVDLFVNGLDKTIEREAE